MNQWQNDLYYEYGTKYPVASATTQMFASPTQMPLAGMLQSKMGAYWALHYFHGSLEKVEEKGPGSSSLKN